MALTGILCFIEVGENGYTFLNVKWILHERNCYEGGSDRDAPTHL